MSTAQMEQNDAPISRRRLKPAKPKPAPKKQPSKNTGNAARARRAAGRKTDAEYAAIALARKHAVSAVEFLISVMDGSATHKVLVKQGGEQWLEDAPPELPERVRAAKELLDRGMGKPTAKKEVTHSMNAEHLAALKALTQAVERLPGGQEPETIDVTPRRLEGGTEAIEQGDREKMSYAAKAEQRG